MSKNSEFMTKINRLPPGTELFKTETTWEGKIYSLGSNEVLVGPIINPDLGTVTEHLLILHRRKQNEI